jgi:hypothetical protein
MYPFDVDTSDSEETTSIELMCNDNGVYHKEIFNVPYITYNKNKRLICFSTINREPCKYSSNCTYAHSLNEQVIDDGKLHIYNIIADKNLGGFISMSMSKREQIYELLSFFTHYCDKCNNNQCTGGYNCRNGACVAFLKICKNDLMSGECINPIINIQPDTNVIDKLKSDNFEPCHEYKGCINGHHLTSRGLMPYCKYLHQKESHKKQDLKSFRYIKNNLFARDDSFQYNQEPYSDFSTDEETDSWFRLDE